MEERIKYLLEQFSNGHLSDAEMHELSVLSQSNSASISDEIVRLIIYEEKNSEKVVLEENWSRVLKNILNVDKPVLVKKTFPIFWLRWAAAAAVVLIVFSFASYFLLDKKKEHVFANDIAPGKNKAILTLGNGKKISLSDAISGNIAKEAGFSIEKTKDGLLVYNISKSEDINDTRLNTISTPNGGEWQIRLPDGSSVWLNAASSIQYCLNIGTAKQRVVKLDGEAYFEVFKNKEKPFIVETTHQSVEVLGTHFNINSYKNENVTKATLIEGSIRVTAKGSNESQILKPGEQSFISSSGLSVKEVDVDEEVAWKDGYFMFNNEKQESILRKVARWYNVEVEYADQEAKNVIYYGSVSRFDKISQVLRKFEQTGEVRFDIKGNKLIVYKE